MDHETRSVWQRAWKEVLPQLVLTDDEATIGRLLKLGRSSIRGENDDDPFGRKLLSDALDGCREITVP